VSRHAPIWVIASILGLFLLAPSVLPQEEAATPDAKQHAMLKLAQEVRKQIVTQPQYGVFDSLHFAIEGSTVILRGKVSRPTLKSSVENSVRRIEGVNNVKNEIEVLPVSPNDDRLRAAVYASIYGHPALQRYTRSSRRLPCDPHYRRKRQRDLDGCGGLRYGSSSRWDAGQFCSGRA